MPSINGPSITFSGSSSLSKASWVSASINSVIPFTRLCFKRSSMGSERHSCACFLSSFFPFTVSDRARRRSVASSRRLSNTSSTCSSSSLGMSSYTSTIPAFTIPISKPALMAWKRKALCMASLTVLFPLKEKEIFDTPPETFAPGRFSLIHLVALMKSTA